MHNKGIKQVCFAVILLLSSCIIILGVSETNQQKDYIITNLIRMNTDLDSELIKELNSYYDMILDMARKEGNYVF